MSKIIKSKSILGGISKKKFKKISLVEYGFLKGNKYFHDYLTTSNSGGLGLIRLHSKDNNFKTIESISMFAVDKKTGKRKHIGTVNFPKDITPAEYVKRTNQGENVYDKYKATEGSLNEGIADFFRSEAFSKFKDVIQGIGLLLAPFAKMKEFLMFFLVASHFKTIVVKSYNYQKANTTHEHENDEFLFKGQKENDSAYDDYKKLTITIKSVINTFKSNNTSPTGALIYGPPGTGKTAGVKRALYFAGLKPGKDYIIQKGGSASVAGVYKVLWEGRNKIVVLDDFDDALNNHLTVNLMKAALDSTPNRILSFPSNGAQGGSTYNSFPEKFTFKGRIILLTNLPKDKLDTAIMSRVPYMEVAFDAEKTLSIIKKMIHMLQPTMDMKMKQEVVQYVDELYTKNKGKVKLSQRIFASALNYRLAEPEDWKILVKIAMLGE